MTQLYVEGYSLQHFTRITGMNSIAEFYGSRTKPITKRVLHQALQDGFSILPCFFSKVSPQHGCDLGDLQDPRCSVPAVGGLRSQEDP